jgi:hypothetical protein
MSMTQIKPRGMTNAVRLTHSTMARVLLVDDGSAGARVGDLTWMAAHSDELYK